MKPILPFAAVVLATLAAASGLLHGLVRVGALTPWPLLDMDRTVLWQKVELAERGGLADLVLVGDSSCLLDVDARALPGRTLNLGTVSHLSLAAHGRLLERYLARAPQLPGAVIVLLHPDALRREEPVPAVEAALDAMLAGRFAGAGGGLRARVESVLGIELLRQGVQARVLPVPLARGQGARFGFTSVLRDELWAASGSLAATGRYVFAAGQGRAVYRVAAAVKRDSRRLPAGVPLYLGLTPLPASFAPPDHAAAAARLLREWGDACGRPVRLLDLPAVLPDERFADRFHLNQDGRRIYTEALAVLVSP